MEQLSSLHSESRVDLFGGELVISTSDFTDNHFPVLLQAGPFTASIDLDKAEELGTEIIRAAQHYRAAMAEYRAAQAAASGQAVRS